MACVFIDSKGLTTSTFVILPIMETANYSYNFFEEGFFVILMALYVVIFYVFSLEKNQRCGAPISFWKYV